MKRMHRFRILIFLFAVSVLAANPAWGQTAAAPTALKANVVENRLDSKLMGRQMPYRVVLPVGYKDAANAVKRYPVLYLLHGLTGHFDNWTSRSDLAKYAEAYQMLIVTPEGENGWYTDSLTNPREKYESYIIKELIPEIDSKYRTDPVRAKRAIAGLSMGGYGALKFGIKYPGMFVLAGSLSGALRAAQYNLKNSGAIGKSIEEIFGPEGGETRNANDVFKLVSEMPVEKIKSLPFIYLDCGIDDFIFQQSRDFSGLLIEKKVPHEYRELPGAHNWQYWDKQVKELLVVASQTFTSK